MFRTLLLLFALGAAAPAGGALSAQARPVGAPSRTRPIPTLQQWTDAPDSLRRASAQVVQALLSDPAFARGGAAPAAGCSVQPPVRLPGWRTVRVWRTAVGGQWQQLESTAWQVTPDSLRVHQVELRVGELRKPPGTGLTAAWEVELFGEDFLNYRIYDAFQEAPPAAWFMYPVRDTLAGTLRAAGRRVLKQHCTAP